MLYLFGYFMARIVVTMVMCMDLVIVSMVILWITMDRITLWLRLACSMLISPPSVYKTVSLNNDNDNNKETLIMNEAQSAYKQTNKQTNKQTKKQTKPPEQTVLQMATSVQFKILYCPLQS